MSGELPTVARHADLVWEVAQHCGQRGALHIERQTKPDANIGERVAEYGIHLWLRDHLPIRSLVIFLRPAETVPQPAFVIDWNRQESLRYMFDIIHL